MELETTYRTQIKNEFARRMKVNPKYSLRSFSRSLGFEASVISQILSGKRIPSIKTANKLLYKLNLSPQENHFFIESLIRTRQNKEMGQINPLLSKLDATIEQRQLQIEHFQIISEWYHYAILALTYTNDFSSDPRIIAKQLAITQAEAKLAIDRLLRLKLLRWDKDKLVLNQTSFTTADKNTTNAALKHHQRQILEKALSSLEEDSIEIRSHSSMTMAIDSEKIPLAKQMIEDFTQKLSAVLESGRNRKVYEISLALFPLQRKECKK